MINKIPEWHIDSICHEALNRYGFEKQTVRNLYGNESFVYSCKSKGKEYVLKISHCSRRSIEQIKGEVDWLHFLANQRMRVSRVIVSKHGHFVETISKDGSCFTVVAYKKEKGNILETTSYEPELLRKWGQTMGRMHALAKVYQPTEPAHKRLEWHENEFMNAEKWLPASETSVKQKFNELCERLHVLPKGKDDYGLIHSDLHHCNFLVDHGEITVIDFDDLEYHWFFNDIVKALYNEAFTFSIKPQNRNAFARFFLEHFMQGYLQENQLDPMWSLYFQDFLKLRHIFVYIRVHQHLDLTRLDETDKNFLAEYRTSIEQDRPLLDLDRSFI